MKRTGKYVFSIIIVLLVCTTFTFALDDFDNEKAKAKMAVVNRYDGDGYTVKDGIPTLSIELGRNVLETNQIKKIKSFKLAAKSAKTFNFELYDETAQAWGSVFAYQNAEGDYEVSNTIVNRNNMIYGLENYEYDEIVIINDLGDYYICIKNGDEEFVIPGVLNWGKNHVTSTKTSCTVSEFFNALYYRQKYDPYNPDLLGSRGSKPVFNYIGLYERKQMLTIIIITSTALLVAGAVVATSILSKRRKAK